MDDYKKKRFFRSYSAVFQGGGCRVPAFAGAYEFAVKSGLHFTEVAGTSGGAIMAALIGAGATPDFILDCLKDLKFTEFLRPADELENGRPKIRWRLLMRLLKPLNAQLVGAVSTVLNKGGIYSSSYIQEWMDIQLSKLLPHVHGPVKFDDLPIPAYIVATDLQGCKPKIWSKIHSRDDYVALAVRASCSIPFFFQPVKFGDNRLVDGGVLSNLPTFVFTADQPAAKPLSNDVIAFQLQGDYIPMKEWSALATTRRLVDAVVDGATELQQKLQPHVRTIIIPTGSIEATDFTKIDNETISLLIRAGADSTKRFVEQELTKTGKHSFEQSFCSTREDAFAAVVARAEDVFKEVIISQRDAMFIWKLFPTILFWRHRGISIKVLLEPIRGLDDTKRAYENARRSLLSNLGAIVRETEVLPHVGYIFDGTDGNRSGAVLYSTRDNDYLPVATCYLDAEHRNVVGPIFEAISDFFPSADPDEFIPEIIPYDRNKLENDLKSREHFYNKEAVSIRFENSVPTNSLYMYANQ